MRLTSTEESRDRITNQFRALEISIEPTKTQLENITRENLSLKEKHMVESNDLRTQISSLRFVFSFLLLCCTFKNLQDKVKKFWCFLCQN